jgi:hypothetical protein
MPACSIVSRHVWDLAQARLATRRKAAPLGGRSAVSAKYFHLLSGLLKCGACGGSMTVIGARMKNGRRYAI